MDVITKHLQVVGAANDALAAHTHEQLVLVVLLYEWVMNKNRVRAMRKKEKRKKKET